MDRQPLLTTCVLGALLTVTPVSAAQTLGQGGGLMPDRPVPYPIRVPADFARAIENGTRTADGRPGPAYWQNWSDYRLDVRIDPEQRYLEGSGEIRYRNNAPDTLKTLHLQLYQNVHAIGVPRLQPQEVTGGIDLDRLRVNGQEIPIAPGDGPGYGIDGTRLDLRLPEPMAPGESVQISFDWEFLIPRAGADERMGWDSDNLFFIAYWYPKMAVYDDVVGWQTDRFLTESEFYDGFGDYEYTVEVPADWVVVGTGTLQNADEVLAPTIQERLERAGRSDDVVHVVTAEDFGAVTRESDGNLTWSFRADSVRDVAFSLTRESRWDAARAPVGDRDGDDATDYARIDALYRESAPRWAEVVRYGQHAISFLSRFTGVAYPWPHMSAVEGGGIIGGGMEFPMMTLMGDYNQRGDSALYYVTAHEYSHMWIPMLLGTDELRYSWMDEGMTTFNENQARMEFFPGRDHNEPDRQDYLGLAGKQEEGEIMRWSDHHVSVGARRVASYDKPATLLVALQAILGEETFNEAYRTFYRRWAHRHPYPWDLFNTLESVSGRDLEWLWRAGFYETWTLDQGVASVSNDARGTEIVIENVGWMPMPVHLVITLANGDTVRHTLPVDDWLTGVDETALTLAPELEVVRVEIDPDHMFPDVDRSNNVWQR